MLRHSDHMGLLVPTDGIDAAELPAMLGMRTPDLELHVPRDGENLDRMRARLRLIESDAAMTIAPMLRSKQLPRNVY